MRSRVIFAACVLAASEVGAQIQPPVEPVSMEQDAGTLGIWPGYQREVCHTLKRGDKRRYSFKSDVPLEFDIHYHMEDAVVYLAIGHGVQSKEGFMAAGADGEEIYCWMWVNLQMQPAQLTFRIWEETP
jgi:hypothetical protein